MNSKKFLCSVAAGIFALTSAAAAFGQAVVLPSQRKLEVVSGNNLYCAGYVQMAPFGAVSRESSPSANEIIGAYNEQDGWNFSENNFLFINAGVDKGVRVGDLFSVVRPRGQVKSRWSRKDDLGFYVQELGFVEVVRVKQNTSVVRVKTSCDSMMLGDLLVPFQQRATVAYNRRPTMDMFADPTGKATGRILFGRDNMETITRDQIVYVDLGAEDNATPGDFLTIYRYLGKGNPLKAKDFKESVEARNDGYSSFEYRGGKFSNQATRKGGSEATKGIVTTPKVVYNRPEGLRKVVGEGMIVNVRERVATVVITRTAQEIHSGDWVEIQ